MENSSSFDDVEHILSHFLRQHIIVNFEITRSIFRSVLQIFSYRFHITVRIHVSRHSRLAFTGRWISCNRKLCLSWGQRWSWRRRWNRNFLKQNCHEASSFNDFRLLTALRTVFKPILGGSGGALDSGDLDSALKLEFSSSTDAEWSSETSFWLLQVEFASAFVFDMSKLNLSTLSTGTD